MEFIEQVLTNIEAHDLPHRYLVMNNAAIHKTIDVKDWVNERGFEIIYLPLYSPFFNPLKEFWSKCKDVVNKYAASERLNTKLSDRSKRASEHASRKDCQAWVKHFFGTNVWQAKKVYKKYTYYIAISLRYSYIQHTIAIRQ